MPCGLAEWRRAGAVLLNEYYTNASVHATGRPHAPNG